MAKIRTADFAIFGSHVQTKICFWHLRCSRSQGVSIHPYITHILLRSAKKMIQTTLPQHNHVVSRYSNIPKNSLLRTKRLGVCWRWGEGGCSSRSPSKMKRNMWSQQPELSSLSGKLPVQSWSPDFRSRTKVKSWCFVYFLRPSWQTNQNLMYLKLYSSALHVSAIWPWSYAQ